MAAKPRRLNPAKIEAHKVWAALHLPHPTFLSIDVSMEFYVELGMGLLKLGTHITYARHQTVQTVIGRGLLPYDAPIDC